MNDEFLHNVQRKGAIGQQWLSEIPDIIKKYEEKWNLKVLPPYTLTYNYVAPVILQNHQEAVIKIGMPWEEEFLNEMEALKLFNGDSVTKLLKEDRENYVMLIEKITPGTPLSTIDDDDRATEILAGIMQHLHKPLPKNNSFITIFEWTKYLREYPENPRQIFPIEIAKEGIALFEYLINSSKDAILTHGDLHHDNVLLGTNNNWVAIDPKGIAAESLYDVAALIRNPYKKVKEMTNEQIQKLFKRRIEILSKELHADAKRIHQWCLAQTILSGVWSEETPAYVDHSLRIIGALKNIEKYF